MFQPSGVRWANIPQFHGPSLKCNFWNEFKFLNVKVLLIAEGKQVPPCKFPHLKRQFWDQVPIGNKICKFMWPVCTQAHFCKIIWRNLRLPHRYAVKTDPPCTFPSIILLLDHLSKIWGTTFWPSRQTHFWHLWPFGQKFVPQIFERWSSNKIIERNVQGGQILIFVSFCSIPMR